VLPLCLVFPCRVFNRACIYVVPVPLIRHTHVSVLPSPSAILEYLTPDSGLFRPRVCLNAFCLNDQSRGPHEPHMMSPLFFVGYIVPQVFDFFPIERAQRAPFSC